MSDRRLRLELLGRFQGLVSDERPIELAPQQSTALLAYLALHPGRPQPREQLATVFWPDADSETARRSLRQALYALRGLLRQLPHPAPVVLTTTRTTVSLDALLVDTDVAEFEGLIAAAGSETEAAARAEVLARGLSLYQGELLPGFYQEVFTHQRTWLAEVYLSALRTLAHSYEECGRFDDALEASHELLRHNPLAEESHCDLMRLYAAKGQPGAVVRQYQALTKVLDEQLGEKPSEAARTLMESLRHSAARSATARSAQEPPTTSGAAVAAAPGGPAPTVPPAPHSGREEAETPASVRPRLRRAAAYVVLVVLVMLGLWRYYRERADAALAALGRQLWAERYQGAPGDRDSEPTAIVTDAEGNVYVCGMIQTAKHDVDFLTLKYDPNGRKLWEARYNGPGNDVDRARSIAVDNLHNVYVTGDSDNGRGNQRTRLSGLDYATIKYGPQGNLVWARRYNGPGNGEDHPVKLVVSPTGEVYVTGRSWARHARMENPDYATVKYDSVGRQLWVRRFDLSSLADTPADMALDPEGGVVITGSAMHDDSVGPDYDCVTLKYSPAGELRWMRRYGNEFNGQEFANALAVDRRGNVFLTGKGYTGDPLVGGAGESAVTVCYDQSGVEKWMRVYGAGSVGKAIAVGPDGRVYVTAEAGPQDYHDVGTVAYDPAGQQLWEQRYNGLGSREDVPWGITCDVWGNVLVAGRTFNRRLAAGGTEDDYVVVKYQPSGRPVWLRTYHASGNGGDEARAVTTDAAGNVLVTGRGYNGKWWDILTVKYAP